MHIVSVNYQFPCLSETFVLNQITGLLRRGHRVTPWSQIAGDWGVTHEDVSRFQLRDVCKTVPKEGLFSTLRQFGSLLFTSPRRATRLLRLRKLVLKRGGDEMLRITMSLAALRQVDVFHCQFGYMGEMVMWLRHHGLVASAPVVTTFHGHDIRTGMSGEARYTLLRREQAPVIAISSFSIQSLEQLGFSKERLFRVPVAIEIQRFAYVERKVNPPPLRVLMVARLVEEKNLPVALDALMQCRDTLGEGQVELTIVGDGELRTELEGWIRDRNLESSVTLTGSLGQAAVIAEYARHDIFLLSSRAENLPVSIMEAAATGLPVVATRVGAVEELVRDGETGFVVEPGQADRIAERICELLQSPGLRTRMGKAGRDHIEAEYDISRCVEMLETCFQTASADLHRKLG